MLLFLIMMYYKPLLKYLTSEGVKRFLRVNDIVSHENKINTKIKRKISGSVIDAKCARTFVSVLWKNRNEVFKGTLMQI